jgi:pSer/pThr/pTyr-binding forkhead associated (FHA) protein
VTLTLTNEAEAATAKGPRLVIARGIEEGRVYRLSKRMKDEDGWIVGRRPGHAVHLDFDGYASTENSLIRSKGRGRYVIRDLGSKNGTSVNWSVLHAEEERPLNPGDIVGVGRSLLVFADK